MSTPDRERVWYLLVSEPSDSAVADGHAVTRGCRVRLARRLLIAGIGNLFLGDAGFGVEVVRRLAERVLPAGVEVADYGIRGVDLTQALGNGWQGAILVDAIRHGEPAGTLILLEPDLPDAAPAPLDAYAMDPMMVLAAAKRLGGVPDRTLVVGCEPAHIPDVDGGEDMSTELSPEVEAAVTQAVERIVELATEFMQHGGFMADGGRAEPVMAIDEVSTMDTTDQRGGDEP